MIWQSYDRYIGHKQEALTQPGSLHRSTVKQRILGHAKPPV